LRAASARVVIPSLAMSSDAIDSETIIVREDETFDEPTVAAYLHEHLEGAAGAMEVRQFGGGHANLTYLLRFAGEGEPREFVLRRPPLGPVAKGAHDMKREFEALSRLWRVFEPAPRAFLFCDDLDVIGAEFLVMERRHGVVIRSVVPPVFGGGTDAAANRKISEVVIDTLADFHEVDPVAVGLEFLGRPDGFLQRQVQGWGDRYERAKTNDHVGPADLVRWLEANLPESLPATLLHNDWKLDNMAVAEHDPGRCVAVYDWDMCTVGDPLCDLGTVLCSWRDQADTGEGVPGAMPWGDGFLIAEEGARRYCERRGIDPALVPYYRVFGIFKMGVVIQQIYVRYHRGQTQDERFKVMEPLAIALFERALQLRP